VIQHLKWNEPVTPDDLAELEAIFVAEGASVAEVAAVKQRGPGLGLFVRSLVGLDRAAARQAFSSFIEGSTLSANQHQFVDLLVEFLTRRGYVDPVQIYSPPFTNSHPHGVAGLFKDEDVAAMLSILTAIRQNAGGSAGSNM
jgi:type I restriction enzyme R subunit